MVRNRTRLLMSLPALLVVAALTFGLASTAFAAPGDSEENAVLLNSYFGSSLTTTTAFGSIGGTGQYNFKVQLSAGETIRANFLSQPGLVNLKVFVLPLVSGKGYGIVESRAISSNTQQLSFSAPVFGMYKVYLGASSMGTFTVSPSKVGAVPFTLSSLTAPATIKRGKSFDVSVKVMPRYNGPLSPMKFVIQRKVSGKWRAYSTVNAHIYSQTSSYTKYHASARISRAGTFRIRARLSDAAHKTPIYKSIERRVK